MKQRYAKPLIILLIFLRMNLPHGLSASRVETAVATLKRTAKPVSGIGKDGQKIAEKVQSFGPAAIPFLLRLLQDSDKHVRELAAYTLSDMDGFAEEHLDALIESQRRDAGWIPRAIARIGNPRAVTFLFEELLREREGNTQVTSAIAQLGERAVPELLKLYRSEDVWDRGLEEAVDSIMQGSGQRAASAIAPLLAVATDEASSTTKRMRAMRAIGQIGLAAERAVPELQKLQRHSSKEISTAAESAIVGIGTSAAVPILVAWIENVLPLKHRGPPLTRFASLGTHGRSAGPFLMKYLADDDWDVRIDAIETLGWIGYSEASEELIKLLDCADDWRQVFYAVKSLQLLKSEAALLALSKLAQEHWFPPVRTAAIDAVRTIRKGITPEAAGRDWFGKIDFFDHAFAGRKMDSLAEKDVRSLRFPLATNQNQIVKVAVRKPGKPVREERWVGVKVADGSIAGCGRGEFGGEVAFVDETGEATIFAHMNTEAIYQTADGIFAVSGLAHMGMNDGTISRISKNADGVWTAKAWRALPGAPKFSRLLKDGQILVSCNGGIVRVGPDGGIKYVTRGEALKTKSSR